MTRARIVRSLAEAVVTMLAALATLFCASAIDPQPGSAVLAVVLCMSLSRTHLDRDLRGRLESFFVLPPVGLAAFGVSFLLAHTRWLGAAAFIIGMFVSIWVRRFGATASRVGSLIGLPFVAILVTPRVPTPSPTAVPELLIPLIIAVLALVWVTVFHQIGRWTRILPPSPQAKPEVPAASAPEQSSLRPVASTRMALQMAAALIASFVLGYLLFPERWAWIVLTAFIVGTGNRGRLDVAYKSVLRIGGAAAGTTIALLFAVHLGKHDAATVALILVAVFFGIWFRPLSYAWWALFVTLALALLQGYAGTSATLILLPRLEEIVIGAALAVASAWLVFPVRSRAVLRRRLADALAALSRALELAPTSRTAAEFVDAVALVEQVAPAFRALRRVSRTKVRPADWADALADATTPALALIDRGDARDATRRAVGDARRSLREPSDLTKSLRVMTDQLREDAQS
ncbi:FUSC family protein [Nakamurella antarctica]|uniref:FUSC family protein n=1 Tax=Nakamurella antarctica TaxID=1902245 RepID=UPI0013DE0E92|nr:FUSC family protein [Nakamurella antarctica]